jgi:hypothetical protein
MSEMMIGTSAYAGADADLMRRAGMGWVRQNFSVPFDAGLSGPANERYLKAREQAKSWVDRGMNVMGVSPLPGICHWRPDAEGTLRLEWERFYPDWMGELGTAECAEAYEDVCAWLAEDLRGIVAAWQIANELDIEHFAGPLSPGQGCELVMAGARGLKGADPELIVGHNPAGSPEAYYFFDRLFGRPDSLLDYCGIDGYYGTWAPGGPGNWSQRVAELHALTGAKVLVNEWGFSSAGQVMTAEESASGVPTCRLKKWRHTWGAGHTPEGQAQFVKAAFNAFCEQRDALLGAFFYRWEDQDACWQCGEPDCPAETAWGLVDLQGRPKPAHRAHGEGAARLRGAQPGDTA